MPESKQRPLVLSDPACAKVLSALGKRFPEIPTDLDKTPGYDAFLSRAKQIYEELEPDFDTFVDTFEWLKTTHQSLSDIATATADLTWASTPLTTEKFLDLVTMYCQVNLLWAHITDRRMIVACFCRAFLIVKTKNEPNYPKVAQYLIAHADTFKLLRENIKHFSKRVGQALVSLLNSYTKVNNIEQLRKEGALNITLSPEKLPLPSQDSAQLDLLVKEKMYTWAAYGFLFCLDELAMPGALDLCRTILAQAYCMPLFRNVFIPIHQHYTDAWKGFKSKTFKLNKEKKIIADGLHASTSGQGLLERRNSRIYLRQSLRSLVALFKDFPGLLGPKAIIAWGALSAAKAEVFWYFRHVAYAPKKDKFNEDVLRDPHISELLYLINQMSTIIRQNQRIVQAYYIEYLHDADCKLLEEQVNKLPSHAPFLNLLKSILNELQSISLESFMSGAEYNFATLRLNWARVESMIAGASSTITPASVKELIHRGKIIYLHTRNVDEIEEQIEQYASLKGLWYFCESLNQVFEKSIADGPSNPLNCMSFLSLLAEFPENATGWLPAEKEAIGARCVKLAEDMLTKICQHISSITFEIGRYNLEFGNQLNHVHAAYPLLKNKEFKFDKNHVPPSTPGAETHYKNRKELDTLRLHERNVFQLCAAIQEVNEIVVYDTSFNPREFLREKLVETLRRFLKKHIIIDEQNFIIQRPSILERKLQLYLITTRLLENYVNLNFGSTLKEFLLRQVYNKGLSNINKVDFAADGDLQWGEDSDLMKILSKWYSDFVSKRLAMPGLCYSANRKAFISRADLRAALPFRPEDYVDLTELQSLVRLVGPYGVRAINRETMKFIISNIPPLKDILTLNRKVLMDIAFDYKKDISIYVKALKEIDTFINRSIAIGNALQFRQLLLEAQRTVAEKEIPFILRTVDLLFDQYPRNTLMKAEFLETDSLAMTLGLRLGSADQALKAVLCKLIGEQDKDLWSLLPVLYAVSFVSSKSWTEAVYHPSIDGYSNNVNTLSLCISALLIASKSTSSGDSEPEIVEQMKTFIQIASYLMLKQAQQPAKQLEKTPLSLPSAFVFMDKFVQESTFLSQDVLEGLLPYSLLRSMYKQLYDPKALNKKGKALNPGGSAEQVEEN